MWVLHGPFDSKDTGFLDFQAAKLVKADKTYTLGRKATALVINHKKISKDHCEFIVGSLPTDVSELDKRPSVSLVNKRDKTLQINRGGNEVLVHPFSTYELVDGDDVVVAIGAIIQIRWTVVCCYIAPSKGKTSLPLSECASLGVNVVHTLEPSVTHHLTPTLIVHRTCALSLIQASHFVKPEWLSELVRLGTSSSTANSTSQLENSFGLPSLSKFKPTFSPSLPSSFKSYATWESNEGRVGMWSGIRFLFVVESSHVPVDGDLRRIVSRAKGDFSTVGVRGSDGGIAKGVLKKQLGKVLSQVEGDPSRMVVVADGESLKCAVGEDGWEEIEREVSGIGLQVRSEEDVIRAVLQVDVTELTATAKRGLKRNAPDEPQSVNMEEEVEAEEPPRKKLVRRAPSRQSTPIATQEVIELDDSPPPPPRRPLRKRAGGRGATPVIGIDDPSHILDAEPQLEVTPPVPVPSSIIDLDIPIVARPHKLRRRAQTQQPEFESAVVADIDAATSATVQPALGRLKALFDATHPDSQTQTQLQNGEDESGTRMGVIREEEEEEGTQTQARGKKRSREDNGEDGEEMRPPLAKKRDVATDENIPPPQPQPQPLLPPPSNNTRSFKPPDRTPTESNEPDIDPEFLKAIHSKRGKKKDEEVFDREFNNLKISKPDLERMGGRNEEENEEDQRRMLEEFGDEGDIRGNFMVVVAMDVDFGRNREKRAQIQKQKERGEGDSTPNFKKFKKNVVPGQTKRRIELVVSEAADFGTGSAYWQSETQRGSSQTDPSSQDIHSPKKTATATATASSSSSFTPLPAKARPPRAFIPQSDSDKDEDERMVLDKPPSRQNAARAKKLPPSASTLFLDDSDEEEEAEIVKPSKKAVAPPKKKDVVKKKATIIVEDSDDETAFKGFGSRRR